MKYIVSIIYNELIVKSFICDTKEQAQIKALNLIIKELVSDIDHDDADWFHEMISFYKNNQYDSFIDTYNFNYDNQVVFYPAIEAKNNKRSLLRLKDTSSKLIDTIKNIFNVKDIIE